MLETKRYIIQQSALRTLFISEQSIKQHVFREQQMFCTFCYYVVHLPLAALFHYTAREQSTFVACNDVKRSIFDFIVTVPHTNSSVVIIQFYSAYVRKHQAFANARLKTLLSRT